MAAYRLSSAKIGGFRIKFKLLSRETEVGMKIIASKADRGAALAGFRP
jgi:hypothetical protein